ncbi:transcriptional regulator NrdR, partial [Listeria monocytogenes]|nr:transcriptional regulator NrdR [Listeria monocytogenes]
EQIEEIVNEVERELRNIGDSEIASDLIGEKVMNKLANLDEVAYVRFASVYRQFKDISVFVEELKDLMEKNKDR